MELCLLIANANINLQSSFEKISSNIEIRRTEGHDTNAQNVIFQSVKSGFSFLYQKLK